MMKTKLSHTKEDFTLMEQKQYQTMLWLVAFILAQPLIDVLTTASIKLGLSSITIGIVARLVYLLAMALWITNAARTSKRAKWYFLYLAGLALLVIANFANNYFVKDPFLIVEELTFYTKVIYFHVLFFGFLLLFEGLAAKGTNIQQLLIRYFVIVSTMIGTVFIIAQVTGTSLANYARSKDGWTGWFYAGNEIGASMAILLPIAALYAVEKTRSIKDMKHWIPTIMLSLSMLALGTKVGYGGVIIVLGTVLATSLILLVWKKDEHAEKPKRKANLIVSTILLAALLVSTPFTPVFGNMFAHLDLLGVKVEEKDQKGPTGEADGKITLTGAQVENLVFSSREKYKDDYQMQFQDAPMSQKLLGLGYAGNYEKPDPENHQRLKTIEMDFHDWFYSFGFVGFLYMVAPLIYFSALYVIRFFASFKRRFDYDHLLMGIAFLIGVGIAYTAGHVLTAPAVSIYLAFLFAAQLHTVEE